MLACKRTLLQYQNKDYFLQYGGSAATKGTTSEIEDQHCVLRKRKDNSDTCGGITKEQSSTQTSNAVLLQVHMKQELWRLRTGSLTTKRSHLHQETKVVQLLKRRIQV